MEKGKGRALAGGRLAGVFLFCVSFLLFAPGCKRDDMADQARFKALAPSSFYADGASARMAPANTVARDDSLEAESVAWTAAAGVTQFPMVMTRDDLVRGQERFQIYCTPCHGMVGDGDGMVPQRGFTRPPSYHIERLRNAPPSYFFNVMTHGIGAMYPYRAVIGVEDRWRIAAYIRALQISQEASATGPAPTTEGER